MLKICKKAIKLISFIIIILAVSAVEPILHSKYLRYEVGNSTVQVLSLRGGGGTGFAIKADSGKEYIMTNRHVCEGNFGIVRIKSSDQLDVIRRIVYMDDLHDLCLIEGVKSLSPLDLGSEPNRGDQFFIVGHPGLRQLTLSQGEFIGYGTVKLIDSSVTSRNECRGIVYELGPIEQIMSGKEWICVRSHRAYSTTAVAYPGNSGSPVVNEFGNVVGVLFAGSTIQERDNYVVPLRQIKRVLAKF